jgi:hypothetical protein
MGVAYRKAGTAQRLRVRPDTDGRAIAQMPPAARRRRDAWFDRALRQEHRRLRPSLIAYLRGGGAATFLTAPIVYSLIVPLVALDLWITVYQWICFPVYGVARVPRRRYFALDRHKLAYLNAIEKVNCTFCSYANGLFAYAREVAARTEQYWCPIKHARRVPAPHSHYDRFVEYGDAPAYRAEQPALRRLLSDTLRGGRRR